MLPGTQSDDSLADKAEDDYREQIENRLGGEEIRDRAQQGNGKIDHTAHCFSRPPIRRITQNRNRPNSAVPAIHSQSIPARPGTY